MPELVLGLDGGGSKTQAWLADTGGRILGRGLSGASNYNVIGKEVSEQALLVAVRSAFEAAGLPFSRVAALCLGLSGVGRPEDRIWVEEFANNHHLADKVVVINDAQLLLWAGTPQAWGLGLISGTGSIAFGRAADGKQARSGGWGWLVGDEGSGYEMGIKVLRGITQAVDRRRPATSLLPRLLEFWQISTPQQIVPRIYRPPIGREEIARLAALAAQEAGEGDSLAAEIEEQAGQDLAALLLSTARQLEWQGAVPCALGGGVLVHNKRLTEKVIENARGQGLLLDPCQIVTEPVSGAVRCALEQLK